MIGWYWFATERIQEEESVINGKAVKDTIWCGLDQGFEEEWDNFSRAEIESPGPMIWEIPKNDLPYTGKVEA